MYHNIINNHQYNQGLIVDYLFSRKDLRLNPYLIEQNVATKLNPSCKETMYIEKKCKLKNMLCKGTIIYYLKNILPINYLFKLEQNITDID